MRPHKLIAAVSALALTCGLGAGAASAAPISVDEKGVVTGGYVQNAFGDHGQYEVTRTVKPIDCNALFKFYTGILKKDHNNHEGHKCWGTFPYKGAAPVGVQYVYPKNIASMGKLPVILYTPGIGAEPGMTDANYSYWASRGYIVAVSYSILNWTGYTDLNGAMDLQKQAKDTTSPLYGHIDEKNVVLAGHSAGGGATESGAGWMLPAMQKSFPGLRVVGAVPLQPGPSLFFQQRLISVPTFVVSGELDTVCPDPTWVRDLWNTIDRAPAWIAMMKGALHGQAMDIPTTSAFASSVMAFAEYVVHNNAVAKDIFVGPQYKLASDPAFMKVERNAKAAALK